MARHRLQHAADSDLAPTLSDARGTGGSSRRAASGSGLGGGSMTQQVSLLVVLFALVAAIFAYFANVAQVEAGFARNEATERRSKAVALASDAQARRTDQALNELARDLVEPARKAALQARADALQEEKEELLSKSRQLETEAGAWDEQGRRQVSRQHRWIEAVMVLQLALLLGAVTLLARRVWVEVVMAVTGLLGIALGIVSSLYG